MIKKRRIKTNLLCLFIIVYLLSIFIGAQIGRVVGMSHSADTISKPLLEMSETDYWIIRGLTIVENKTLTINKDILVQSGGTLVIKNSILYMNGTGRRFLRINVYSHGELFILNSTITSLTKTNTYYIHTDNNAVLYIDRSVIEFAGYSWSDIVSGIWINTGNAVISNSVIRNNYVGLNLKTQNTTIINCNITGNSYGIVVSGSKDVVIKDSLVSNNYYGIIIKDSSYVYQENIIFLNNSEHNYVEASTNITLIDNTYMDTKPLSYLHIGISFSRNVSLIKNRFLSNATVIYLDRDSIITLYRNIVNAASVEINVYGCNNTYILNNTILSTTLSLGLYILMGENFTITNNIFYNASIALYGGSALYSTLYNNFVNDKPVVVVKNQSNIVISDDSNIGELLIINSYHVTVQNLTIHSTGLGVYIFNSTNIQINHSSFYDNRIGIEIEQSNNISITATSIYRNNIGMSALGAYSITVEENRFIDNSKGLALIYCDTGIIKFNNFSKNGIGIYLFETNNFVVFLNNFINNSRSAVNNGQNSFDNGTFGNYWSDFVTINLNGDDFWDFEYKISDNVYDGLTVKYI